jgi:competence protein ComEC
MNYYQATERKIRLGPLIFHILPPANPYIEISELNNNSAVIRLDYGKVSFLFPGDIESERESQLLNQSRNQLNVDILKVPHHGSFDASSSGFIQAVNPVVAIISCGEDNPYGYPHQETLQTLKENGIKTYRTDRHGTILVQTDGNSYQVIILKKTFYNYQNKLFNLPLKCLDWYPSQPQMTAINMLLLKNQRYSIK